MGNNAQLNEDCSQDFTFVFLGEGSYVLAIEEIEHEGENIRIPIQVTPEFPFGVFVVIAGLLASIIAATRVSFLRSKVIK
jgi:prepilin signal peptidase PulO-like enzyme (type II secretory pathway)